MNVFELFGSVDLKGMGKVQQDLTDLEKKTKRTQTGLKVMGAAFTAIGGAGLVMIQSTKAINASLGVTALNLDITTKELRDLTLATTNVTFPIKEVTASFDMLARAGIKDKEVLQATATAFDTLGDALGMSASQVTDIMVPAMKTFRLSAEEVADKTDIMTYMVRNSTISLEDFNTMVGYTSQDMVDAGLTIDDMAAAMMYMSDSGVEPGKVMLREWNKAVVQSQTEGIALTEALGMTSAELEVYKGKLEGATGLTEKYADAANEQYTIMDKVKQKFGELTLKMSEFVEPLEPILAGMTALGPVIMMAGTAAGTAAIKWVIHTAALMAHRIAALASAAANWVLHASLGPVGWALAAISAVVVVLVPIIRSLTSATSDASVKMDDYSTALLQNEIASGLTADEWLKVYDRGYLLTEQFEAIARSMRITTTELRENMLAADMLSVVMIDGTETGRIYVENLQEQVTVLEEVKQKMREVTTEQEALTSSWENFVRQIAPGTKAFREYGLTTEDVLRYMAQTEGSIDAVIESLKEQGIAANDVQYYLDELGLSAKDVAEFVGKKKRAVIEETEVDRAAVGVIGNLSNAISELGTASAGVRFTPSAFPDSGFTPERWEPELTVPVSIEVNGMVIREEADIYKVAEELYRLTQDRVRATGG